MKKRLISFLILILLFTLNATAGQHPLVSTIKSEVKTTSSLFQVGERLTYLVKWSDINAARFTLETKENDQSKSYQLEAKAVTIGAVKDLLDLKYLITVLVDPQTGLPQQVENDTLEGTNTERSLIVFDQTKHTAVIEKKETITIPPQTYDIISLLWAMRNLQLQEGRSEKLATFHNRKKNVFSVLIEAGQTAEVTTAAGKFVAQELSVKLLEQSPTDKYAIRIWITKDMRRLPVLITSLLPIGKLRLELSELTISTNEKEKTTTQD